MRLAAVLVNPICAFLAAVERCVLQNGFVMLLAYGVGDLAETLMILDLIAEFLARNEGRAVCDKVVMSVML